jgi:hypothetical protein
MMFPLRIGQVACERRSALRNNGYYILCNTNLRLCNKLYICPVVCYNRSVSYIFASCYAGAVAAIDD